MPPCNGRLLGPRRLPGAMRRNRLGKTFSLAAGLRIKALEKGRAGSEEGSVACCGRPCSEEKAGPFAMS